MCSGLKEQSSEEWTIVNYVLNQVLLVAGFGTNNEIEHYFLPILGG